jgi:hypothetical protein
MATGETKSGDGKRALRLFHATMRHTTTGGRYTVPVAATDADDARRKVTDWPYVSLWGDTVVAITGPA